MIELPVKMSEMKESGQTFFIELYKIELRTGTTYICACDEDITYNGQKYLAVPFQRESLTRSMDNITDSCQITLSDVDYGLLAYVMNGFDFRGCNVTVVRIQYPDSLTDPSIVEWVFSGFIDEPAFSDGTFSCKIMSRFPEINCPNRNFSTCCDSEFGDDQCKVDKCETTATVTAVDGNTLTVSVSKSTDFWKNGVATISGESRIISSSKTNMITVNVNFIQDSIVDKEITLERGCNKTQSDCRRFSNLKQFSGFPAIPFESIYR